MNEDRNLNGYHKETGSPLMMSIQITIVIHVFNYQLAIIGF